MLVNFHETITFKDETIDIEKEFKTGSAWNIINYIELRKLFSSLSVRAKDKLGIMEKDGEYKNKDEGDE